MLAMALVMTAGCERPPRPPEVLLVEIQEQTLWRDGADVYKGGEFLSYRRDLNKSRNRMHLEETRFAWFVNYDQARKDFADLFARGRIIRQDIKPEKEKRDKAVRQSIASLGDKAKLIKTMASSINEGRLARRDLTRSEVLITEAGALLKKEKHQEALSRLNAAAVHLQKSEEALRKIGRRYADKKQIAAWMHLVAQARQESKKTNKLSILVSKLDSTLIILQRGKEIRKYQVALGRNGLQDKLYAGDQATPEGSYQVVSKLPQSRYYKALLINYPNDDDKKFFNFAKKKGWVPAKAKIGGLVEIHGGGQNTITNGCIALDNSDMEEIFNLAEIGTPVTIVGSFAYENSIFSALD